MPRKISPKQYSLTPEWYETKKFLKLNKKWHNKLEKSGFYDHEDHESVLGYMKDHHNDHFRSSYTDNEFKENQRYYELATQLIHTYPFKDPVHKTIWELYADGKSMNAIVEAVKKLRVKNFYGHKTRVSQPYVSKVIKEVSLAIKRDAKDILEDLDKLKANDD